MNFRDDNGIYLYLYLFLDLFVTLFYHDTGLFPGQFKWDLWWMKWHGGRFSQITLVSPVNSHFTKRSTFINDPVIAVMSRY
jgi:hypothetical protein